MSIFHALSVLCLLILISAFVSCSELALASARKIKLQVMAKDGGDTRALDVLNMQQQPGSFITIVQIGLNAVAILAGIVGEAGGAGRRGVVDGGECGVFAVASRSVCRIAGGWCCGGACR